MKNQTAVEWLLNEIDMQFPHINIRWKQVMIEKALEMEKEQIEDAFNNGVNSEDFFYPPFEISESEQYYNETYKNI
jgi:disulfide oxidoreductase YuzD